MGTTSLQPMDGRLVQPPSCPSRAILVSTRRLTGFANITGEKVIGWLWSPAKVEFLLAKQIYELLPPEVSLDFSESH